MPYDEMMAGMQHRLELDGRERLVVSGVEEVERFDEEEIVMSTTAGNLGSGWDEPAHREAEFGRRGAPCGRHHPHPAL